MAGAGFKSFSTGEVLLAADVNTYLMQQTVMVFDDASARTTALGANVAEGMMSYLKDTNKTYRYDGSSWLDDAGTTSPLTTKGDLWGYSTTDARLPVGTDGYTLVADSAETLGVKWAAPAAGGKVLQVVNATYSSETDSNSTTFADTGLTASITPSSASNKVMVIISAPMSKNAAVAAGGANTRIVRGATSLASYTEVNLATGTAINNSAIFGMTYLDSPNTTSSTTYKLQFASATTGTNNHARICSGGAPAIITLLEIGA